jgi:hypothetical protein
MIEPPLERDIQLSNALILIFVGSNSRNAGHHLFPGGAFSNKTPQFEFRPLFSNRMPTSKSISVHLEYESAAHDQAASAAAE